MSCPVIAGGVLGDRYCFGFNGKELDPEGMGGGGSTYDYGFRIYNPGIARFLSVDPLSNDYPWYTPYQFAGNKPIIAIDLDGLEEFVVINQAGQPTFELLVSTSLEIALNISVEKLPNILDKESLQLALKKLTKGELVGTNGKTYQSTKFKKATYKFNGQDIPYLRGIDKGNKYFSTKKLDQLEFQKSKGLSGFLGFLAEGASVLGDLIDFAKAGLGGKNGIPDANELVPFNSVTQYEFDKIVNATIDVAMMGDPKNLKSLIDNSPTLQEKYYITTADNNSLMGVLSGEITNVANINKGGNNTLLFQKGDKGEKYNLKAVYIQGE